MLINVVKKKEKEEKIKLVFPNILANRLDIRRNENYELLEIIDNKETVYIPFYINNNRCFLSVYMMPISKKIFNGVVNFIKKEYKIFDFHVGQSLNDYKNSYNQVHWLLKLPESIEEYESLFTKKSLYNRRRELKLLEKDFNIEFCYFDRTELNEELITLFLQWKQEKGNCYREYNIDYILSNRLYLTDAYTLKLNNKIVAIILYSTVDNKTLYCENMAFDEQYAKYQVGNILFYYSIKMFINRKFQEIYLGGGNYKYKENCKAIKQQTRSGNFSAITLKDKIFNIIKYTNKKIIYFLGLKITINKPENRTIVERE